MARDRNNMSQLAPVSPITIHVEIYTFFFIEKACIKLLNIMTSIQW